MTFLKPITQALMLSVGLLVSGSAIAASSSMGNPYDDEDDFPIASIANVVKMSQADFKIIERDMLLQRDDKKLDILTRVLTDLDIEANFDVIEASLTAQISLRDILTSMNIIIDPFLISQDKLDALRATVRGRHSTTMKVKDIETLIREEFPEFPMSCEIKIEIGNDLRREKSVLVILETLGISLDRGPVLGHITPEQLALGEWISLEIQDSLENLQFTAYGENCVAASYTGLGQELQNYVGVKPFMPFPEPVSIENLTDDTLAQLHGNLKTILKDIPAGQLVLPLCYPFKWNPGARYDNCGHIVLARPAAPGAPALVKSEEEWKALLGRETIDRFTQTFNRGTASQHFISSLLGDTVKARFTACFNQPL